MGIESMLSTPAITGPSVVGGERSLVAVRTFLMGVESMLSTPAITGASVAEGGRT